MSDVVAAVSLSNTCGLKVSDCKAATIFGKAAGAWLTVNTRAIKLNCKSSTPSMPASFLRIKPSSVGQSIS